MTYREAIVRHLCGFFEGHEKMEERYLQGPMAKADEFSVLRFAPGPRTGLWTYCSVCASVPESGTDKGLEFVMLSPRSDFRIVQLVTMVGYYHRTEHLGAGHTFPIGEPWLDSSRCDCILTSVPYPFGPDLEVMRQDDQSARFVWLLPITESERKFVKEHGLEALESRFDVVALRFWEIERAAVV